MQFNRTKDLHIPFGEESVKSVHGSRWEKNRKRVNFETRIEVLGGGNVDYGRYPVQPLSLYVGKIGRRPHLGHI